MLRRHGVGKRSCRWGYDQTQLGMARLEALQLRLTNSAGGQSEIVQVDLEAPYPVRRA